MSMNEAETRKNVIDPKLMLAGYKINHTKGEIEPNKVCVEIKVKGMEKTKNNPSGIGYIDYVIFGADAKPLALIEAKKESQNEEQGKIQACLYADCLEKEYKVRPIIYYTNGISIKIIDGIYPARDVFGFHSKDELTHLIQKRDFKIVDSKVNVEICDRYYQKDAIQEVLKHFESKHSRSLIILATGSGKTRVSCALSDIFIRNNYVKRILFLADRKNLVKQAKEDTYDKYLGGVPTSLIIEGEREGDDNQARIVFSTYQSMLSIINELNTCPYGIGHFDLIIIDEAHRSLFNKYGNIFSYFDALMIGLTATPRNDVSKSTYKVFNIDNEIPTYEYDLVRAVKDGYLTYFRALDRTPNILKHGLKYDDLSEEEKEEYENLFDEEDTIPKEIDASKFKEHVLNKDTIRKVLSQIMEEGLKVNNGEILGKTIIFAKDHNHAILIQEIFREMFPELSIPKANGVEYCVVIDNQIKYNDVLQREFKAKQDIRIVVSVDMMDTGVDIPEVVNLVFFKNICSKIKFWQMIGRGTRLCKNLNVISPSEEYFKRISDDSTRKLYTDKQGFLIFDICDVFPYFELVPEGKKLKNDNILSPSQLVFVDKVKLFAKLQKNYYILSKEEREYYSNLKTELLDSIKQLNPNYLNVQKNISFVMKYSNEKTWDKIEKNEVKELETYIAILILGIAEDDRVKSFDRLCYQFSYTKYDDNQEHNEVAKTIYRLITDGLLKTKLHISEVAKHEDMLRKVVSDEFLKNASVIDVEEARIEIRKLITYIDKKVIKEIISDFEDRIVSKGDSDNSKPFDGDCRRLDEKIIDYIDKNRTDNFVLAISNFEVVNSYFEEFKEKVLKMASRSEYDSLFSTDKDLITFARRNIGISQKAIEKYSSDYKEKHNFNEKQKEYIQKLLVFISENGTFERKDILNEDLNCKNLFNNTELNELIEDVLSKIPEML